MAGITGPARVSAPAASPPGVTEAITPSVPTSMRTPAAQPVGRRADGARKAVMAALIAGFQSRL